MDSETISAMSGVLGSLVGGTASTVTAWITQKTASQRELMRTEMSKQETLYGEFIGECSKLLVDAWTHTLEKPETLLACYALLNRIRLSASDQVLAQGERLLVRITEQYFSPNMTLEELRDLSHSQDADPMRAFAEACREELKSIRARA